MVALNEKHKRFCDEYLIDLNATQAYLRAGYKVSERVAAVNAARLLANPKVQAYVAARQQELQHRTGITQEWVLEELHHVAAAEAADYTDTKLKYSNKLKALELLGKHLGLFEGREPEKAKDNGLLTAIQQSAKEVWGDVSAVQSETEDGDDLVGAP